ncbi:hypothetical protein Vadar_027466 [Vaccinium darrowii]|uniref:Uncharacterized protein n=1 Tax=Vaccinium darrowii TaxID=229202 RepID=A0ACB7YPV3_9ERIC|nr:hypothetical protein Vadar_027466 [Vaccinium darrowii]
MGRRGAPPNPSPQEEPDFPHEVIVEEEAELEMSQDITHSVSSAMHEIMDSNVQLSGAWLESGPQFQQTYQPPPQKNAPAKQAVQPQQTHQIHATQVQQAPQDPALGRDQIIALLQEQLGPEFRPMGRPIYTRPYSNEVENESFPKGYRVPEFHLFFGEDIRESTIEHVARFQVQCGEAGSRDALQLRLFPNSLTHTAFTWYINLPLNSIQTWRQLENMFHQQFYRVEPEVTMADLSALCQLPDEGVETYLSRFKTARFKCRVSLPEKEYVRLVLNGLNFKLKKKFNGVEFRDLFELSAKAARYENILKEEANRRSASKGTYYPDPNYEVTTAEMDCNPECAVAEMVNKKPHVLRTGSIELTVDAQDKIERGEFKFEAKEGKKVLGVDKNPFPGGLNTNMVSVNMRGLPRTTPWAKISLGGPAREAKRSGYEDYESEDEYKPFNRPLFQQQRPRQQHQWSRWSRPAPEIRKSPRPRCPLTCNKCGQRIDSQRSQVKDKAINYYPSRPQGLSQERKVGPLEKHFSVFSRLTTGLENVQEDLCKLRITAPNQGRRRTVKPRITPPHKWYKVEHPKFPARPPPLSRSQKRRYQWFRQTARRAREESELLEGMEEDTWEDTEMLEALEQDSMEIDHFDEAMEFMTKGARRSSSASTSTTLSTSKEVSNSCEESPEGRREHKPKQTVTEDDAPEPPRQVRMLKRTQPTPGKQEFMQKA